MQLVVSTRVRLSVAVQQAKSIDSEMKNKLDAYKTVKTDLQNYERKQGLVCSVVYSMYCTGGNNYENNRN